MSSVILIFIIALMVTLASTPFVRRLAIAIGFVDAPAQRNLHIGDSKNDIQAAHAAGCLAYAVPYGYNEGEPVDSADCDALVSDLLAAYRQALTFQDLTNTNSGHDNCYHSRKVILTVGKYNYNCYFCKCREDVFIKRRTKNVGF